MEERQIIKGEFRGVDNEIRDSVSIGGGLFVGLFFFFVGLMADNLSVAIVGTFGGVLMLGLLMLEFRFINWLVSRCEIVVTNLRVYGKTAFGVQVDLPLDSITSIGRARVWRAVTVSTPTGRIAFRGLKNADEVFNAISGLLRERTRK